MKVKHVEKNEENILSSKAMNFPFDTKNNYVARYFEYY